MIKRIVALILSLFLLTTVCFAAEESSSLNQDDIIAGIVDGVNSLVSGSEFDDDPDSDFSNMLSSTTNNIIVSTPTYSVSELSKAFYEAILQAEAQQIDEYSTISNIDIQPLYNLDNGSTPIPSGTLRSVLTSVIGPYSPVVVQYQYTNGSNVQYLREIMPDYQWMISAAIFALVLYCVFRLWGVVLCRR